MHIHALVFDFSRVLLFPTQSSYQGKLNALHTRLASQPDYLLSHHFYLNAPILEHLKSLTSLPKYIYTAGHIQELPEILQHLSPIFTAIYTAAQIGPKTSPDSYSQLVKSINVTPERVLFIDDSSDNINAAQKAGLNTHLFTTNNLLISALKHLSTTQS